MGEDVVDQTKPVRAGEELDLAKLSAFLREQAPSLPDGELTVEQFPGGHSNLTYLARIGDRELVVRRPPFGNRVKTAHDMGREVRILSGLSRVFALAPRPLAHTEDPSILGAPFYVMERIRGAVLRKKLPAASEADTSPAVMRRLSENFVDTLAALHAIDPKDAALEGYGKPEGYVERQVRGWTKRYFDAKTDDIPEMVTMAKWLETRMPKESGAAIVHNDFKFDNLVLDPNDLSRIVGILDWEMATIGDPLMDLGVALGYWVEAGDDATTREFAFGPTFAAGCLTRRELAERYAEKSGRDVSGLLFHYCFALFKTAGVAQQIYWRYKEGLTQDERFAAFLWGVHILAKRAVAAAEAGTF